MKAGLAVTAATLATLGLGAPALADSRWDRDDNRREWRDDRNDRRDHRANDRRAQGNAYTQGYRDGWRAENRRDQQQYRGNYGWQQQPAYNYRGTSYPTYRGAAVRGSQPYWWGQNGQVYCRRQDGTAGLLVGALAGGTLGNMIAKQGDKTLGSVIGGTLGAVLGNEIAKGNARCR